MRKNRLYIALVVAALGTALMTGCGSDATDTTAEVTTEAVTEADTTSEADTDAPSGDNTDSETKDTVAYKLKDAFLAEIENNQDVNAVAETLSKNPVFAEIGMGTMEVAPGYLNGFSDEVKTFKKGCMFSPMIGSMPCVGYVFETDTPDKLVDELTSLHMLNWNICTTADEMVVEASGNYVFFVMAPFSFEE